MHQILVGDCRTLLQLQADRSIQCCVTSPPYFGLRDYGVAGQIGLEQSADDYVREMVAVFREVKRTLKDDGTLWLNLGDTYAGLTGYAGDHYPSNAHSLSRGSAGQRACGQVRKTGSGLKTKDLILIPSRVALALQADGWYLRSQIVWHKPNPMPERVRDRPTSAWEAIFLLSKRPHYYYDADAVAEPSVCPPDNRALRRDRRKEIDPACMDDGSRARTGKPTGLTRNCRNVWTITKKPCKAAHFGTMPIQLAERCILAGSRPGDTILDPFGGAGTTALAAAKLGRDALLIELSADYAAMAERRLAA